MGYTKSIEQYDPYIQQIEIQEIPQYIEQTEEESSWTEGIVDFVGENVPEWFLISALIVGSITLGLVFYKLSKAGRILESLMKVWRNILRGK